MLTLHNGSDGAHRVAGQSSQRIEIALQPGGRADPVQYLTRRREKRRLGFLNVDSDCSRGMPCRLTNEHEIFCSLQANPCSR